MPFKLKNPVRHKFPKYRYKLTNWAAYNAALKTRGKINFWFPPNMTKLWYHKKQNKKNPGRQKTYSNLAILTMWTIGTIFKQRLRQTEGLLESIFNLAKINLQIPDYSTLSRRTEDLNVPNLSDSLDKNEGADVIMDATGLKILGVGEWLKQKHKIKKPKGWRKLHIAIDRESGKILSSELTTNAISDHAVAPDLLDSIPNHKTTVCGDSAYDVSYVYKAISSCGAEAIIPPHITAQISAESIKDYPNRVDLIKRIRKLGKLKWQKESGYNWRSLVETTMSRYKKIIGDSMNSRKITNQKIESKIGCYILNKMTDLAMPETFKFKVSN